MSDMPSADNAPLAGKLARLAELESDFAALSSGPSWRRSRNLPTALSHEINNPLANISTRAQALLAEERHPERRKKLATIVAQAFRAHEMISDLMLFAKPPTLELADIRLSDLIARIVAECQADAQEQRQRLPAGSNRRT